MSEGLVLAAWLSLFAALFFLIFWGAWRAYNTRGFVMHLLKHTYTLGFKSDAGQDLTLEAAATPLFFAEKRDRVAITYLEEKRSYPRAIRFEALTGPRKGEETAVSADWLGPWLGVLLSSVIGIGAIIDANRNKRSKRPTSSEVRSD